MSKIAIEAKANVAGIVANLRGIADVYEGTYAGGQASGLGIEVAALSPEVDAEIRQLLDDAIAAAQAIPTPLADAVVHHRAEVQAAYEAVQALRRGLTVDVASVLGVNSPLQATTAIDGRAPKAGI